mmetsp:Transcript_38553/g.52254  ORF Transcript_38553/g.52254 Transcript_38553/m.52254 type:complete len:248 (-) Transcript_38553:1963-2706(-)
MIWMCRLRRMVSFGITSGWFTTTVDSFELFARVVLRRCVSAASTLSSHPWASISRTFGVRYVRRMDTSSSLRLNRNCASMMIILVVQLKALEALASLRCSELILSATSMTSLWVSSISTSRLLSGGGLRSLNRTRRRFWRSRSWCDRSFNTMFASSNATLTAKWSSMRSKKSWKGIVSVYRISNNPFESVFCSLTVSASFWNQRLRRRTSSSHMIQRAMSEVDWTRYRPVVLLTRIVVSTGFSLPSS